MSEQLLLFQESIDEKRVREIEKLKEQCEKMRKGHFVRYNQLTKLVNEMKDDLEILKSNICKTSKPKQLELL